MDSEKMILDGENSTATLEIKLDASKRCQTTASTNHKLNMNFFYKSILDKTNLKDVGNILFSLMRMNLCRHSHHLNDEQKLKKNQNRADRHQLHSTLASKFINMCCKSIKRLQEKNTNSENERCVPFFKILWNLSLLKNGNSNIPDSDLEIIETVNESTNRNVVIQNADCPSCMECQENKVDFTALILGIFS